LKPLKFIGLIYDPFKDNLAAATRGNLAENRLPSNLKLEKVIFCKIQGNQRKKFKPKILELNDVVDVIEDKMLCSGSWVLNDDKVFAGLDLSSGIFFEKEFIRT
jgi:hypothetical protein